MTSYDWNDPNFRTRRYKGYVQFNDPSSSSDWYRLKEKQSVSLSLSFSLSTHYDDAGMKFLDPQGHTHTFSTTIKLTSDMIDDATADWDSSASSAKTSETSSLSYWIEKLQRYEPVLMTFVSTSVALSGPTNAPQASQASEKYVKMKFKMQPTTFAFDLDSTAQSVQIQGTVTDIVHIKRTATEAT